MAEERKITLEDLQDLDVQVEELKDTEMANRPTNHVGH